MRAMMSIGVTVMSDGPTACLSASAVWAFSSSGNDREPLQPGDQPRQRENGLHDLRIGRIGPAKDG